MRSLCGRWLKSAGGVESAQYLFASLTSHISGRIDGVAIIQFGFLDLCAVAKAARVMQSRMAGGMVPGSLFTTYTQLKASCGEPCGALRSCARPKGDAGLARLGSQRC